MTRHCHNDPIAICSLAEWASENERRPLFGYFDSELFVHGDKPPPAGTLIDQIRSLHFWMRDGDRAGGIGYGKAVEFYLTHFFPKRAMMPFELHMAKWAATFFAARTDPIRASNLLIVFLRQNLEALEHLFILERPKNRHLRPTSTAVAKCINGDKLETPIGKSEFAKWTLEYWLPRHLRHYQNHAHLIESPDSSSAAGRAPGSEQERAIIGD